MIDQLSFPFKGLGTVFFSTFVHEIAGVELFDVSDERAVPRECL
jgi:hypothetical protein